MGSRTRAAEQRVEDQRRRVGVMIDELEARLRADVDSVRSGVSERVEAIGERLSHTGESVPGADTVRTQVHEHPLTSMMGGFGAGVALGMISGGADGEDDEVPRRERRGEPRHRERGMTSRLVEMLTAPALVSTIAQPVQDEVRTLMKELVSGFLGNQEERRPAPGAEPRATAPDARPHRNEENNGDHAAAGAGRAPAREAASP
jgi:hypothetical protein